MNDLHTHHRKIKAVDVRVLDPLRGLFLDKSCYGSSWKDKEKEMRGWGFLRSTSLLS